MFLISKSIILSLCATFIVGYLKQLLFKVLTALPSVPAALALQKPSLPSQTPITPGQEGVWPATMLQRHSNSLWKQSYGRNNQTLTNTQQSLASHVYEPPETDSPAPGQPSDDCNLVKDPEPGQFSYATLEYLMCRNYKDTKCLFFKVC